MESAGFHASLISSTQAASERPPPATAAASQPISDAGPPRGPFSRQLHAPQHDPSELPESIYYNALGNLGYTVSQLPQSPAPEQTPRLITSSIDLIHPRTHHPQHVPHIITSSSGQSQPMLQPLEIGLLPANLARQPMLNMQTSEASSQPAPQPTDLPNDSAAMAMPHQKSESHGEPHSARHAAAEPASEAQPAANDEARLNGATGSPGPDPGSGPPSGPLTGQKRGRNWAKTDAQRKFVPAWSESMPWLVYDAVANTAFCAPCRWAGAKGIALGTDKFKKANFVDHQVIELSPACCHD